MSPVYKEITLKWKGKTYKVTPTFGHIQHIEQRLSLASLRHRFLNRQPPFSLMAELLAEVLHLAGCHDDDATAESIYAEFCNEENEEKAKALVDAGIKILGTLMPQRPLQGNASAPEPGESQQLTSTGANTTNPQLDTGESNPLSSGG